MCWERGTGLYFNDYVCVVSPSSGFAMGPEVFKEGHGVGMEDEAKCLVYTGGWGLEAPAGGF